MAGQRSGVRLGGRTPIDPSNLPRDYRRLVALAGLPRIRIHDLRHTYTALALERGANLLAVSRQLGHAKPSTTGDICGHVSQRMQQEVTDTFGPALFGGDAQGSGETFTGR